MTKVYVERANAWEDVTTGLMFLPCKKAKDRDGR
jgi:hypothetical protein